MPITETGLTEFTTSAMREYAEEVVINRAIPDYRDGLKPVQRVILWQAHLSRLYPNAKHMKLAKLSGLCMTFHPHGDGSIDAAAMSMSQPWNRRTPFIDIHGNNGSIDGSSGAASRYVEARMAPAAEMMFQNIDEDAVDIVDNYDGTAKIAAVLPAAYPALFANGAAGIGFGLATTILPHNPAELMQLCELAASGQLTPAVAAEYYKGPDFPTGGMFTGDPLAELQSATATYKLYADVQVDDAAIIVKGVPYGVSSAAMIESIAALIESAELGYVTGIIDLTEHNQALVRVECRRSTPRGNLDALASLIRQRSKASWTLSASNVCIVDGKPRSLSLLEYIKLFVQFRRETLQRVYRYQLKQNEKQAARVHAELWAATSMATVQELLAKCSTDTELIAALTECGLPDAQARHVAGLKLSQLLSSRKRLAQLENARDTLARRAAELQTLLTTPAAASEALRSEFAATRRKLQKLFPRLTRHVAEDAFDTTGSVSRTAARASRERVIIESDGLGIAIRKRVSDDRSVMRLECMSDSVVLLFTNLGHLIRSRVDLLEITDGRLATAGLAPDERIMHICMYSSDLRVIALTKHGYIKRSPIDKCLPSVTTRANQRKLHCFNPCSGKRVRAAGLRDEVAFLSVRPVGQEIASLVAEHGGAGRRLTTEIDIDWLMSRSDSGSSSGASAAWSRGGRRPVINAVYS